MTSNANPFPDGTRGAAARPSFRLYGLLIATAAIYLVGLHGPFFFDDFPNLVVPIADWLKGEIGWQEIVFGNGSGMLGRPLSMLTFLANAAIGGLDPFSYKCVNLGIHLACGAVIYALLTRLLHRDPQFGRHSSSLALAVAALWMLHPMQVSTVLYVVQRMAQLSALFMLLALLAYVQGRIALEQGRIRKGLVCLFLLLPASTVIAMFCKENGALVPLLCGVFEAAYFRASVATPRPRAVKLFFLAFLAVPGMLVMGMYAMQPQRLLDGYIDRTFTFGERLLSEPRVLMDYIGALLLPRGPSLGLYTDDFAASRNLLAPYTTLFAIFALFALAGAALFARKRLPMFFAGIFFYFAAQAMESSIFALELYFEHRNYLPSVGFFLAVVGLTAWLFERARHANPPSHIRLRLLKLGAGALFAVLAVATFARANIWNSFTALAAQGAQQHPESMRAQMDYANTLQKQLKYDEVQRVFDHVATIDNTAAPHVAAIDTASLQCMTVGEATPETVARIAAIAGDRLQTFEMMAFDNLAGYLEKKECRNLTKEQLAAAMTTIVDAAPQPATLVQLWRTRFIAAKLYVQAGKPVLAQEQLEAAWKTGAADPAVGVFLANVYALNHDFVNARLTLGNVRKRLAWWDRRGDTRVSALEHQLDNAPRLSTPNASDVRAVPPAQ